MKIEKNDLFDYPNMCIYQETQSFKFSLDSILLSEFVDFKKTDQQILDICSGNAVIPMVLSTKTKLPITAFEIQKNIFDLGIMSLKENNLENQIKLINNDIKNIANYCNYENYDIITCNPPYFKVEPQGFINKSSNLSIARHEICLELEDIFKISFKYLKNLGRLYLVHRVSRLDEIIILANKYRMNVKVIQLISTNKDNKPYLVLVKCVKNSKNGVIINSPINILNLKTYQNLFKR